MYLTQLPPYLVDMFLRALFFKHYRTYFNLSSVSQTQLFLCSKNEMVLEIIPQQLICKTFLFPIQNYRHFKLYT